MKEDLVVIIGPTAVGKTKLSIEMAKALNGEVINGDAFQVYKDLDIGTAKVTIEETEGIPHHLIDIRNPDQPYTVSDFQKDARRVISDITQRGKLPILVGGTGLYISAVLFQDYIFTEDPPVDQKYREELENFVKEKGNDALYAQLLEKDPIAAEKIHPNNVKRVIRALEKVHKGGILSHDKSRSDKAKDSLYNDIIIGLTMDRDILYQRINKRVDKMINEGLVGEVESLFEKGLDGSQSVQAIGYKELFAVFKKEYDLKEGIRLVKRNSRRFAKRQMTWFNHQMDVNWFNMNDIDYTFSQKAQKIIKFVAGKIN